MKLDMNESKQVIALLGAGSMGLSIVRRFAHGKKIVLGDISEEKLKQVRHELEYSGYDVGTCVVDACDKSSIANYAAYCASFGEVMYFVDSAGASPNQASPEHIIKLDLIGTAYAIDEFAKVIAKGGAGLVIASQTGYMGPKLDDATEQALSLTPSDELASLPYLSAASMNNSGIAYITAKLVNQLRVRIAAATTWGDKGARINTISPGIIVTPLAYDEFKAAGEGYQRMIEASPAKRAGTSDEIAEAGAFLLGENAAFITGIDLLIDGGVIASMRAGRFALGM